MCFLVFFPPQNICSFTHEASVWVIALIFIYGRENNSIYHQIFLPSVSCSMTIVQSRLYVGFLRTYLSVFKYVTPQLCN